tara:strand:+ start:64 stop:354 length:291 start_codon:yes stop_codon:yes gene_type:complete
MGRINDSTPDEKWYSNMDVCFVTNKLLSMEDRCRWTEAFEAWVSTEGQDIIEDAVTKNHDGTVMVHNPKWNTIYGEWYAKDESTSHILDELEGYIK